MLLSEGKSINRNFFLYNNFLPFIPINNKVYKVFIVIICNNEI